MATDLTSNDTKLREAFNPDKPLESLHTRQNECAYYATVAGKPATEGQVVSIAYGIVADTGNLQEDFQIWRAKLESEKIWTKFQ